ncbi:MAG TPA: hypothetical protein PK358_03550 [Spirochaetota bacterium]|nr:hypothetical protein [Spirochaetota bacterium]HPJ33881.1 hypothetical protein [Spirochaetota bacterium]
MAESRVEFSWKRRPSEIRGYDRAMYTTLNNGDYIRVDYNLSEDRVRLYVEISDEDNNSYYSIISGGRIVTERNSSGKSARVGEKLIERATEFSTLPNSEVLKIINRNYGIEAFNEVENRKKEQQQKEQRSLVKKRYFKEAEVAVNDYADVSEHVKQQRAKVSLIDLIDVLTGIVLAGVFFILYRYSFLALGAVAVFWGIIIGIIDIFLREREPVFSKILFFLLAGSAIYIYDYFYI